MSELEVMRAASRPRKGPRCRLFGLRLDGGDAKTLQQALEDDAITNKVIAQWLAKRGVDVTFWTVARHRRGDCACA